ncbi:MAG TPA: hypothetical protein VIB78_11740 [Acidimicrobiia bacterium]|jgi:hypothetical protein
MSRELKLTISDHRGMGLVNVESDNPWARVWRQAITTGKPTGQWKGIGIRHQGVPFALDTAC